VLQLHADPLVQLAPRATGIEAQQADLAAVGAPQAGHALDGRGLARAVATEDPEDLPLPHREADVIHGDGGAVRLVQMGDLDHCSRRSIGRDVHTRSFHCNSEMISPS
jgi:hypothetical protein